LDNIIGIVTNSETKQGDRKDGKGKWTRYAFQLKDARGVESWYSCFDQSAREVEVGQAYEFAYEVNGDYKNLSTWMTVDADEHGLSMSTPVVDGQGEFRRSKEEVRWTEAYHMATRMVAPTVVVEVEQWKIFQDIGNWVTFFYAKLEGIDITRDTLQALEKPVETPATVETPTSATSVSKTPRGRPKKAVQAPETTNATADFALLTAFNDARVAADMSMEDVNEYIEKTYKVDTVRKLSEVQLGDVIRHIENQT